MLKYKCKTKKCDWIGTQDEMWADYRFDRYDEDEVEEWSNWICPKCGVWHQSLEEGYEEILEVNNE
jgi:hypothetical protein